MTYHRDEEVNRAIISLLDALCSYKRDSLRGSKFLLVPDDEDEDIIFAMDGKPILHSRFELGMDLDLIKSQILPNRKPDAHIIRDAKARARAHFMTFKNPYSGMCDDCPYPLSLRTLEENCGRCAAGNIIFWFADMGKILEIDCKCPACGEVTLESPCPFCTNDVGMPSGGY